MDTLLVTFLLSWSHTMTRSNSREKELCCLWFRSYQVHSDRGGMALGSWNRKLRDHIFSHTQEAARMDWKCGEAMNSQSPSL